MQFKKLNYVEKSPPFTGLLISP